MAHNLNYTNGRYSYMGRRPAWHDLGDVRGEWFSWADICANRMLAYSVEKRQLLNPANGQPVEAFGTFRSDNGAFLGAVGRDYTVIQHEAGFAMIDHLINSLDGAHYETAGALGAGEVVWGLANLNRSLEVVPGDVHEEYLLFSTAHDGSRSHEYRLTRTRVVCQNTLNAALSYKAENGLRVRHTKNAHERLSTMHDLIEELNQDTQDVTEKMRNLAGRLTTRETAEKIFDRLFPKTKRDNGREESSAVRTNMLRDILARFESNDRNAFPEVRGTAYNLLNAITEYTDHFRTSRGGERSASALFGSGDALKSKAFNVIYEVAGTMPAKPHAVSVAMPAAAPIVRTVYRDEAPMVAQSAPVATQTSLLDLILSESN